MPPALLVIVNPTLHRQQREVSLIICYYDRYQIEYPTFWISLMVNLKVGIDFAMLFTIRESRRTSDPVLSRDRGSRLQLHP